LRMAANISSAIASGITATLTGITVQDDIRITFDAWINYNGGPAGGTGSTEFMTVGASANSSLVAMTSSDYLAASTSNQPFNGFFFGAAGEGGASHDYRYYDGNGTGGAAGNNASRANFLGKSVANHFDFVEVFRPLQSFETPGTPGKAWTRWEIVVLDGKIRLFMTGADGIQTLLCDWFTPNTGASITGLRPHLGTMDVYSGLASPVTDNFVLFDNLKVESIESDTSGIREWELF
ncbi:MAG TPA: hypothetical protein PLB62_13350, partial [Candidatus Sumerlaeota bacterium]|nr:hypothetical protein [Candidatus Sumerlaeota bacterium]